MAGPCGCADSTCGCAVYPGTDMTITGSGTKASPYVLTNVGGPGPAGTYPNIYFPADQALLSWNAPITKWEVDMVDFGYPNNDRSLPIGRLALNANYIHQGFTSTGVAAIFAQPSVNTTTGQNFIALYNSSGTKVAQTTDLSAAWLLPGTGATKYAWASTVVLTPGMYWIAFLANGTDSPGFQTLGEDNLFGPNVYNFLTPNIYPAALQGAGLTTPPSSFVPGTNAFANHLWAVGLY